MDTLFRLVNFQYQQPAEYPSLNSSSSFTTATTTTSSSSRSSSRQNYHHHYYNNYHQEEDEECFNFYMDNSEEDLSSSSSKHYYHPYYPHHASSTSATTDHYPDTTSFGFNTNTTTPTDYYSFSSPAPDIPFFNLELSGGTWVPNLLLETARAISDKDSNRIQHLMWMLNELSSPYGDTDQKLAAYFLQALFSRVTEAGDRTYKTLASASEKTTCSFDSTRKVLLKFQEVSPWTTFGHVASNGAILEALEGSPKLHIVDISNTYCTQWPTLLEALATRYDDTPHLRLTTVVTAKPVQRVMKDIGARMEKFARLMGVPFKFNVVFGDLRELNLSKLDIREDEALAVNCVNSLHSISGAGNRRDELLSLLQGLNPRVLTVVEEEADLLLEAGGGSDFVEGFGECLRWFRVYFEALEESFARTSAERLVLERAAGRAIVDLVACDSSESVERRETASSWVRRMHGGGFNAMQFSEEVCDDVRALLRRYREGWSMAQCSNAGIFLSWKDRPVVWASAWRP